MDTNFLWNAGLTVGMAIIGGFIGMGAYLLNQIKNALEARAEQHDGQINTINQKIENTQADLSDYKILVQRKFVNQEGCIRTTQSLDSKIDRVLEKINTINVNVARIATTQEVKQRDGTERTAARG